MSVSELARNLRALASAWLAWWRDVMLGWLPPQWLERSRLFTPRIWLIPDGDDLQVCRQPAPGAPCRALGGMPMGQHPGSLLRRNERRATAWILAIPNSQAIVKDLTLPAAVRSRLHDVLRFELDRHTPFNADSAWFGFEERPADLPGSIRVRIAAVPKRLAQMWLDRLAQAGIVPRQIVVMLDASTGHTLALQWHPPGASRTLSKPLLALGVAALLAITILLVPLLAKRGIVQDLHQRHAAIFPQAQAVADTDRDRERLLQTLNEPVEQRASRYRVVDILRDLTGTVPDDGYLYSLRLDDDELRIDGETPTATALIEPLEALPTLSEVRFLSPTSRVQDNRERFQIGARVNHLEDAAP